MTIPHTDEAFTRGEEGAPDGLVGVEVSLARDLEARQDDDAVRAYSPYNGAGPFGPAFHSVGACELWIEGKAPERRVVYFVGVCGEGAVNVQAAIDRAERDNPGWSHYDHGAA